MVKRSMQRRRTQSAQRARTRSARRTAKRSRMGGKRTRSTSRSVRRSRRGGDPDKYAPTDGYCMDGYDRHPDQNNVPTCYKTGHYDPNN